MPELAEDLMKKRGIKADPASLLRLLCKVGFSYKNADGARTRRRS
jgi:transposase